MARLAAVLLLLLPSFSCSQESAIEHAARLSAAAAASNDPGRSGDDALKAFNVPRDKGAVKASVGPKTAPVSSPSRSREGARGRAAAISRTSDSTAPKKKSFAVSLGHYLGGLIKIPVYGVMATLRSLAEVRHSKSILDPFKAVLNAGWNVLTVAGAELNHLTSPLYALADPTQGPGEVKYSDGLVWTSGGVAGGLIHMRHADRFRYFMPSSTVVFSDKAQVDCDCNPANPGDIYDTNAVNALHEVIIRDRRPIGYFTDFALPWTFSKSFREREESSALQEAIDRLYP